MGFDPGVVYNGLFAEDYNAIYDASPLLRDWLENNMDPAANGAFYIYSNPEDQMGLVEFLWAAGYDEAEDLIHTFEFLRSTWRVDGF